MASKRESLLQYLKTLLATITTGGGYNFTVNTVERGVRGMRELGDEQMPALFITNAHEKRKGRTGNQFSGELLVVIIGYVKNTEGDLNATTTGVQLDLDKLIQDVTKCLSADPLQADAQGNARVYKTRITDITVDDGDMESVSGFAMLVSFEYVTEDTAP